MSHDYTFFAPVKIVGTNIPDAEVDNTLFLDCRDRLYEEYFAPEEGSWFEAALYEGTVTDSELDSWMERLSEYGSDYHPDINLSYQWGKEARFDKFPGTNWIILRCGEYYVMESYDNF